MYKIGLTGGIATGKSTVSAYLKKKHIPIIDCDMLAKQAVEIGKPAYKQIIETFGNNILFENKEINRPKLGNIVFNNKNKRVQLEKIVHKQVLADVNEQLLAYNSSNKKIVVIDIPLLFEAKLEYLADEIWVVYCSDEQQINRLKVRNGLSTEEAIARIHSQMPITNKIKLADIVIDNSQDLNQLYQQIDKRLTELKYK